MQRYFFNVRDGHDWPDDTGTELEDLTAARREAVRFAGQLLQDRHDDFWTGEDWRIEVTDASGLILFTLMFVATDAPSTRREECPRTRPAQAESA